MLRAVALASVLALSAGAVLAQPPGDPGAYGAQSPAQPGAPSDPGGQREGGDAAAGYGAPPQGQGNRWAADPAVRALRQKMRATCASDISTYCADAGQGGHGALHRCMMANQAKFTPACQAAIGDLRTHMHPPLDTPPPAPQPPQ